MAFVLAGADVGLAAVAVHISSLNVIRSVVLGVVAAVAAVWAALDGRRGLDDRSRIWVLSALVAGFASGVLRVVGKAVFVDETGVGALGSALTGDAAFGALVVLVPAGIGLLVGGRIAQRDTAKAGPRK